MASFCTKCGAPLGTGPFCVQCGADARLATSAGAPPAPAQPPVVVQFPQSAQPAEGAVVPAAARPGTSLWLKLLVAFVILFFVCGLLLAGGIYYAAHRINRKIHEVEAGLTGAAPESGGSSSGTVEHPACGLLSKEDVGRAIGVKIIRAQPIDSGCSYIAQGDQAEMTARHTTAMAAAHGADNQQQQMIQNFAGGMFKTFQSERKEEPTDTPGEVPVFQFSIDENSAGTQMLLNSKALGVLGPAGAQNISGIGDEAFVSGESMLIFRKGSKLVRIMYMTCPCSTEAVKPLASKLADEL
jgi:hypothetical protein